MNRAALHRYIAETYHTEADYPWASHPSYAVFRHAGSKKWFAVVMCLPPQALGLPPGASIDVLNLKCDPLLVGSLRAEPGFYPAYHMNKERWVSLLLDGSVPAATIKMLLDGSFALTAARPRKNTGGERHAAAPY